MDKIQLPHVSEKLKAATGGGGEMAELILRHDWQRSTLGDPEKWPQSLYILIGTMLRSKFPMFLWWGNDLIQFYNDAYRPSMGNEGKHPQALGQKGEDCWQEIWPIIKPLIDNVLEKGEATWSEDQYIPIYRNGSLEDVYWTFGYSPVMEEGGKVGGVLVVCTETTEKVTNLKNLAISENELAFAIDAAELATWDYNPISDKFTSNNRLKEWFGFSQEENIPLSMALRQIAERDRERVSFAIKNALSPSKGGTYDITYTIQHRVTQAERIVRAKGKAWFNDKREVYRFNGTLQDVTENVLSERKIKESEEHFRSMADNIPNLAWMARPDGWIFWYNSRWYEYTGTSPKEMEGWGWQSVHDPAVLPSVMEKWAKSIEEGKTFEMIFPLKSADGMFRPFLTRIVPIRNEARKIILWFGTNTDITDLVHTEQILDSKNKELQKTNEDLDNFVYTASHDLKAPISNLEALVQTLWEMIEEKGESGEEKEIVQMITSSIDRLKNTIFDLTELARVQKGFEDDKEYCLFDDVFQEAEKDLLILIKESNATFLSEFHVPGIYFSKRSMRSVLYNLVSNALKYRSPGRAPIIHLRTMETDHYTELHVKDNGLGIAPEKSEAVFSMFKRLHSHVEGSGIGLYKVKRILENAGGRIELESTLGAGTLFKVYFKKQESGPLPTS